MPILIIHSIANCFQEVWWVWKEEYVFCLGAIDISTFVDTGCWAMHLKHLPIDRYTIAYVNGYYQSHVMIYVPLVRITRSVTCTANWDLSGIKLLHNEKLPVKWAAMCRMHTWTLLKCIDGWRTCGLLSVTGCHSSQQFYLCGCNMYKVNYYNR